MLNERYPNWANLYPTELYEEFSDRICKHALSQKFCNSDVWEEYLSSASVPTSVVKAGNRVTHAFKKKTEFKMVTYNLRQGGNDRNVADNHWKKIIDTFSPDLVLAQESRDPLTYFYEEQDFLKEYPPIWELANRKWGSAILSTQHKITPISVPEFKGWIVGAKIAEFSIGDATKPLFVFSIHTPSIEYFKTVNAILGCIKDIAGDSDILMGGDFNVTTAVRHSTEFRTNYPEGLAILDRLRTEFGLINAWQAV